MAWLSLLSVTNPSITNASLVATYATHSLFSGCNHCFTLCIYLSDMSYSFLTPLRLRFQEYERTCPAKPLMMHCRREVLHCSMGYTFGQGVMMAYEHSIIIECCNGITRRFYPRLLTYSADYKEKWVIFVISIGSQVIWQYIDYTCQHL